MEERRRQRAREAGAGVRAFTPEEQARLVAVIGPYAVVSLVSQALWLVVGIRTVMELYRARRRGAPPLLAVAANRPLIGLSVLNLAQIVVGRRLSSWARRLNATPPD